MIMGCSSSINPATTSDLSLRRRHSIATIATNSAKEREWHNRYRNEYLQNKCKQIFYFKKRMFAHFQS